MYEEKKSATYIRFQMDHYFKCDQLKTHLLVSAMGGLCLNSCFPSVNLKIRFFFLRLSRGLTVFAQLRIPSPEF